MDIRIALPVFITFFSSISTIVLSQEKQYSMDEVIVTSSRREIQTFFSNDTVGVVSSSQMAEKNSRTLPDALSFESGIQMQKTNPGGGSAFIRGLTGKEVLILVDGVRLNNSTYRFGPNQYLNTIDPSIVEHIEVVRGPGSVMYGSDALGGVINIITKKPSLESGKTIYGSITSRWGSQDESSMNRMEAGGIIGKTAWGGGVTLRNFNNLRGGGNIGLQKHTGYDETDWNFSLRSKSGPGKIDLTAGQTEQNNVPRTDKFTFYNTYYMYEPQRLSFANLSYDAVTPFKIAKSINSTVSFKRSTEGTVYYKIGATSKISTRDDVSTIGFNLVSTSMIGMHQTLVYGVEYYRDDVSSFASTYDTSKNIRSFKQGNFPDGTKFSSYGIYIEDSYGITPKFETMVGLRYSGFSTESKLPDYGNYDSNVKDLTWSGSLAWLVREDLRAIMKVSRGFRAPNLDDTVVLGRETGVGIDVPSPDLEPVTVNDYEFILKSRHKRVNGELSLYYMDFDGLIARTQTSWNGSSFRDNNGNGIYDTGDEVYWGKINIGDSCIYGTEASMNLDAGPLKFSQSIIYTFGQDKDTNKPLTRIPPLKYSFLAEFGITNRLNSAIVLRAASKQDRLSESDLKDLRIPAGGTPGYAVIDIRTSWRMKNGMGFYLVLENLTDKAYKDHGSGFWSPGRGVSAGLTIASR